MEEAERESLKTILGDHFNFILTDTSEQCLDCLDHAKDIDLVIVDSDPYIVAGIKEKQPSLRVVVLTGHKETRQAEKAVKLGASGYLMRPFEQNEILSTIKSLLDF